MNTEQEIKIKEYVTKYAKKHHISYEEASKHLICMLTSNYYCDVHGGNKDERKYSTGQIAR